MNRKELLIAIRAMAVTIAVFVFFGALFVAMNNTERSITGEAFELSANSDGIIVDVYGDYYLVSMDLSPDLSPMNQLEEIVTSCPEPLSGILFAQSPL